VIDSRPDRAIRLRVLQRGEDLPESHQTLRGSVEWTIFPSFAVQSTALLGFYPSQVCSRLSVDTLRKRGGYLHSGISAGPGPSRSGRRVRPIDFRRGDRVAFRVSK